MHAKPQRTTYTALDFRAFREGKSLEIAPDFQRRSVWSTPARSFFVDTLIRGYPVPPIYLRVGQSADRSRTVREVIDGQQRLRSLLGYIDGEFPLAASLSAPWAGKTFDDLDVEAQDAIREFPFICEVLTGISDREVLEIFARLNTYSTQLNAQELRNGTYFGRFKQTAYGLAHDHVEFWRRHKIITQNGLARMAEVELTSELVIAMMAGLQDKKKSISQFYADYDESFAGEKQIVDRFKAVVDEIVSSVGEDLADSEFRRVPLFYSLFCAIAHRRYGIPHVDRPTDRSKLTAKDRRSVRDAVARLSDVILAARRDDAVPQRYAAFVNASLRQTDNIQPRRTRLHEIYEAAF